MFTTSPAATFNVGAKQAGIVNITWNLTNDTGQPIPAGVYIYRLDTPNFSAAKRMVVVR